jgi:uncharacterized protein (TIGR02145 family)
MRKCTLLFLLFFTLVKLQAQDYLISFAGSGASVMVDSVIVVNLTQGTRLTVGNGNQLQLLGTLTFTDPAIIKTGNTMAIYPNPSTDDIFVSFEATAMANASISVSDISNRQVASAIAIFSVGRHVIRISGLNYGIYAVQINSEAYRYSGKMISQSSSGKPIQINPYGQASVPSGTENLKNAEEIVQMQYNTGDLLKFTGRSGIYATVVMDVPTTSKTITFDFAPCTDYDSNNYTIIQIGNQTWMEENLQSTHYSDGTSAAYYDYDHDPNNSLIYGRLYGWSAAMNGAASSNTNPSNVQGICPDGWHLPSVAEWQQLAAFLGGSGIAGGKLKETGNAHWISPNAGATDEVGFTALPAGMWAFWDEFQWLGDHGAFSTSTGNLPMVEVSAIMLQTSSGIMTFGDFHPDDALSARCIKDY